MNDKHNRKPYPMPVGLKVNGYYARVLAGSYCGCVSELTSIHQYLYHHLQVEPEFAEVGKALHQMAVEEMHHLHMLGQCVKDLGLFPEYQFFYKDKARFWDASFVSYGKDLKGMLMADIRGEYEAIAQYNWTIDMIPEPQVQKLLQRIIEDEEGHIGTLYSLLELVDSKK